MTLVQLKYRRVDGAHPNGEAITRGKVRVTPVSRWGTSDGLMTTEEKVFELDEVIELGAGSYRFALEAQNTRFEEFRIVPSTGGPFRVDQLTEFNTTQATASLPQWRAYFDSRIQQVLDDGAPVTPDSIIGSTAVGRDLLSASNEDVARTRLGLSAVDNTADVDKPVSAAVQAALNGKLNTNSSLLQIGALTQSNDSVLQVKSGSWNTRTPAQLRDDMALDTAANLRARSSHTGTQAISTVSGLQADLDAKAAAISGKVDKGSLRINAGDYATLKDALAAANTPGAYVHVPYRAGGWLNASGLGNGATVMADDVTIEMASGAVVMVQTWGQPGIDCINRSGVKILGGRVDYVGTRVTAGTGSYRGSNETSGTAGVWINRDRCTVDGLRTVNMPVGVYMSSWDGTTSRDRVCVGNAIRNTEHEGMNFGVLWTRQRNLRISNVYGHDDIDDSGGVNPTHVLYGASSDITEIAEDIVISNCVARNIVNGHAYQLKWASNVQMTNVVARNAAALVNMVGCTDVTIDGQIVDARETAVIPSGWVTIQDFASARIKGSVTIVADSNGADHRAVHMAANDCDLTFNLVTRRKTNGSPNTAEVRVLGTGNRVTVNVKNVSAYPAPVVQVGDSTNNSSNNRITLGRVSGCSRGVDLYDTAGGSTIHYTVDHLSLTDVYVSVRSGSPVCRTFSTTPAVDVPLWVPADNGYLGSSCDPQYASAAQGAMTAGVLHLAKVKIPAGGTLGVVRFGVTTAGSGLTSGQCLIGVYNSAGTLIGTSADLSTDLATTGTKTAAITVIGGQSLAVAVGGFVLVGLLQNGTTPAQIRGTVSAGGFANDNLTGLPRRYGTSGTSQTALPSSISTLSSTTAQWWFAVTA